MYTSDLVVESKGQNESRNVSDISILLELAAADDLEGFNLFVEQKDFDVDDSGLWYGRSLGSKKMKVEERTPLIIASMFGSKKVLKFILGLNRVDVNKSCGSDRVTALHMAVAGGSSSCVEVVKLLIEASADTSCLDVNGNRPVDLICFVLNGSNFTSRRKLLELMLNGYSDNDELCVLSELIDKNTEEKVSNVLIKKEYPVDLSLPDIKNGIYNTDEFRMYSFKIKPCSRAYSHDWTECPFVHPGENARRRDPRKYHYSCVPCPEFRKGSCRQGDNCEYAHGIFECWLHPAQYRTRLCKDEVGCNRKVCFFAHKVEELRPLHPSTGSALLSPRSLANITSVSPFSPGASSPGVAPLWSNQSSPTLKAVNSRFRDFDVEAELIRFDRYHQQQLMDDWNNKLGYSSDYIAEYDTPTGSNRKSVELLLHQNMNYSLSSSFGANQIMSSRSGAFSKRSQSFIDRQSMGPSKLADWRSPDGKLNWGIEKEELNKLRKSASFGVRSSPDSLLVANNENPDLTFEEEQHFSPWLEEQLVA